MNQARVSVFLPVYNGAGRLRRQLESMAAQTFKDFTVTIIDNASEDETPEIAREFADKYPNFHYIRNRRNLGFHFSYMKGFYISSDYEFMVYASHNDYWHPEYLEQCVKVLNENPRASIAYSWCQFVDDQGEPVSVLGPDQPVEPCKDPFDLTGQSGPERFLTIIGQLGMCTAFYGLLRTDAVLNSIWSMNTGCLASDNLFLAIMASREGPFFQIPRALFFRELPYAQGKDVNSRKTALHQMNRPQNKQHIFDYGYLDFLWAHAKCALGRYNDAPELYANLCEENAGKLRKYFSDISGKSVAILLSRYKTHLAEEAAHGISQICRGLIYQRLDDPATQLMAVGDSPMSDFFKFTEHYERLSRFRNFLPDAPDLYTAIAICLVKMHRHREALVVIEEELSRNPTSRPALELKAQLEKHLAGSGS